MAAPRGRCTSFATEVREGEVQAGFPLPMKNYKKLKIILQEEQEQLKKLPLTILLFTSQL